MNLHRLLQQAPRGRQAGPRRPDRRRKFGSMFLAQVPSTPGIEVAMIADLAPDRARAACRRVGWDNARIESTRFTDDATKLLAARTSRSSSKPPATPPPASRTRAAPSPRASTSSWSTSRPTCWPARSRAQEERAGVVYSLAYGDQPALICELVDWARACGFSVIAAGKGTKYLPEYHASTPATVWGYYGLTGTGAHRRHEPADVQLVPGWHEIRHRNGRGRQRHRPDPAARRPALPALRHA